MLLWTATIPEGLYWTVLYDNEERNDEKDRKGKWEKSFNVVLKIASCVGNEKNWYF